MARLSSGTTSRLNVAPLVRRQAVRRAPTPRSLRVMRLGLGLSVAAGTALTGCIPREPTAPGTRPPPPVDPGGIGNANQNDNSGSGGEPTRTQVFDIRVSASSLEVSGIGIGGTLTVVFRVDPATGIETLDEITLADDLNDFDGSTGDFGISGGVFVTTAAETGSRGGGFFDVEQAAGGTVTMDFRAEGRTGENPNRFILQADGIIFEPGVVGVTYEVGSPSRVTFRIDGRDVQGILALRGTPINDLGSLDTYSGSFNGTARAAR